MAFLLLTPAYQINLLRPLISVERSNRREGLPPSSPLARELERRVVSGELTFGQAAEALTRHYRQGQGAP